MRELLRPHLRAVTPDDGLARLAAVADDLEKKAAAAAEPYASHESARRSMSD